MICFIMYMYSRLVILAFQNMIGNDCLLSQVKFTKNETLRSISKVFLTLYGAFNLEFFHRARNSFCISSQLAPIYVALLGYVSAFYPFLLIAAMWVGIELHDHNFQPVVIIWKPFHRCIVQLGKGWDTKRDITNVFGSLFILSYTKIMYQTLILLSTDKLYNYSITFDTAPYSSYMYMYVLSTNSSITIRSDKYIIIIFTFTRLIFCVCNLHPALLFTLSPFQWFRSVLSKCRLNTLAMNHFLTKFHHSYTEMAWIVAKI